MRKRAIKLLSVLFITSSLLVALFPFLIVFADSNTYVIIPANTCYLVCGQIGTYGYNTLINSSVEIRSVGIVRSGTIYWFGISEVLGYYGRSEGSFTPSSCNVSVGSSSFQSRYYGGSYSGHLFYFVSEGLGSVSRYYNGNYPLIYDDSSKNMTDLAYDYTFGENSYYGPEYGNLIIEGYSTDIAGSGSAAIKNIDHIKWNPDFDTNGNDISNMKVRVKIVPGNYIASRSSDLLLQKYDDFIENQFNSDETLYNASDGEAVISWEYIVNKFDNIINRIYLFNMGLNADTWEKQGWLYKLRLEDESNDYIGDWQTVYSSTSSGVENDLNIVNNNTISQEFITTLQEINNINNVENNWTVNNTDISVTNNYTEPQQGEKPWWAYLLESILNTFNITNNYIYEGDSNTQNITNTVNDSNDDMNRKIGEYQQFENSFIDDMDNNLTDIDTDIDFLYDNKFIASANWVAQQYNRMTNNTVIGSFIGFSLLFGLALIFIGKIHR